MPTVLVTGANRGLGLEFAKQYATDGWHVLACVRDPARATALASLAAESKSATHGGRIDIHALDVADHASIDALARTLAGQPIDVLLNNAGTMGKHDFARKGITVDRFGESDFDDWISMYRVNVFAPMHMAEAFLEHVARSEQKKIVSLSSVIGSIAKNSIGGLYSYRSSKAALNAVMRSMAIDLGRKHGIIATAVHPGWARTEMGGPRADVDPAQSVAGVRQVIAGLTRDCAGRFWMFDGSELPW